MKAIFPEALLRVLAHEGGYVNDPRDPGGATNHGVTWRVYDAWRANNGLPKRDVREITDDEVAAIYRQQYWDAIRGDDLPSGLDYAVFDFAVHAGPARAAQYLQRLLGVKQDGQIGQITLAALAKADAKHMITALCADRLAFLRRLKTWPVYGKGWGRRVEEVEIAALAMVDRMPALVTEQSAPGKAEGPEKVRASLIDAAANPAALTAAGSVVSGMGVLSQGDGPVQYAIAAVAALAAVVALVWLVRRSRA